MKLIALWLLFMSLAPESFADAEDITSLRESLQKFVPPTPEEILSAGLALGEEAQMIMKQKKEDDCKKSEDRQKEQSVAQVVEQAQCVICALINEKNVDEYQLLVGTIEKKENGKIKSPFTPYEIYLSYQGKNDQPFHGLFEDLSSTGSDMDGYTYGSIGSITGVYKWGSISLDVGTELYVLSLPDFTSEQKSYYINDEGKYFQKADEHSFVRMGAKLYLNEGGNREGREEMHSPYMRFSLGIDHDSDQGNGKAGAIAQREVWHEFFNKRGNVYLNHMQDRTLVSGSSHLGLESFKAFGKLGLCSLIEGGVSASSNGTIRLETKVKASIDSGTFLGGTRKTPLLIFNIEAGVRNPVVLGNGPKLEVDSEYGELYENRRYPLVEDLRTSYTSVGANIGGRKIRFNIDAIFEKNQWNDGDIIYQTGLQVKY